jgi:acyl-CoA thioesterase-1
MRDSTALLRLDRRTLLALAAALAAAPALIAPPALAAGLKTVTLLGDSITAGYGLGAADALPNQLALALTRIGANARVRGAGVSGDTTADALARVDFSVQPDTDLCVVALGGNDLLQGVDPKMVEANLTAIVRRLKARRLRVLIAGMRAPVSIGADYARAFNAVFPAVARSEHAGLYPYLLDGVGGDARLNQSDHIHPNPAGVKIIASRLAPVVARALTAR